MAATKLHEELAVELDRAVAAGVLVSYEKVSTGQKLVWHVKTDDEALKLDTTGASAFVLGLRAGRRSVRTAHRPNPLRDVIERDGEVRVPLDDPSDPKAVKRQRNALFSAAYTLGFKGRFTVKRDGDALVGRVA